MASEWDVRAWTASMKATINTHMPYHAEPYEYTSYAQKRRAAITASLMSFLQPLIRIRRAGWYEYTYKWLCICAVSHFRRWCLHIDESVSGSVAPHNLICLSRQARRHRRQKANPLVNVFVLRGTGHRGYCAKVTANSSSQVCVHTRCSCGKRKLMKTIFDL